MDEESALRKLVGSDEVAARAAFDVLYADASGPLTGFLTRQGARRDVAEDLVQDCFVKIWARRRTLEFPDGARWQALLHRVARNCWLDYIRSHPELSGLGPDAERTPDPRGNRDFDAIADAASIRLLKRVADTLWLGLPPGESDDERNQRLLAAQIFYLRGKSFDQTLRLALGADPLDQSARRRLENLLRDPATVRFLASRYLLISPEKVFAAVLDPYAPPDPEALNRLTERAMAMEGDAQQSAALGGWSWREVKALALRFRFCLDIRQSAAKGFGDLLPGELVDIYVRSNARLPFESRVSRLLDGLDRAPAQMGKDALTAAGLWRRLVFEFGYVYELPHKEIVAWLAPCAVRAGYAGVTDANVNILLSNHRLIGQLSAACREALGDWSNE